MVDLSRTIEPKSDQLNSDDLIGGPRTITITRVSGRDNAEQPIAINFEGDNGKPYMPCKSMRRVMVQVWGKDGTQYVGRSMTIYRDPDVQFGGMKVGGIRISHMTNIDSPVTMALTATRANKKPFTVKPLQAPKQTDAAANWTSGYLAKIRSTPDPVQLKAFVDEKAGKLAELRTKRPELAAQIDLALGDLKLDDDNFATDDFIDDTPAQTVTLEVAKAQIDAAPDAAEVNTRAAWLKDRLPEADADELMSHAAARVHEMKQGAE